MEERVCTALHYQIPVVAYSCGTQQYRRADPRCCCTTSYRAVEEGILGGVVAALRWHAAYYAVISLGTTMLAGHLMLYRIIKPEVYD